MLRLRFGHWAILALAFFLNTGCSLFNIRSAYAPIVKESRLTSKTFPATKEVDQIEVLMGPQKLPQGFFYVYQRRRTRRRVAVANGRRFYRVQKRLPSAVHAIPSYPSSNEPHAVVAVYRWGFPRRYRGSRYDIPEQVRKKAAALGANTLFRLSKRHRECYALRVSDAVSKETTTGATLLLNKLSTRNNKFSFQGDPTTHEFKTITPISLSTEAMHCYKLAIALHPRAFWSDTALRGILSRIYSNDPTLRTRREILQETYNTPQGVKISAPRNGKYAKMRAFTINLGCSTTATKVSVRLSAIRRSQALGRGKFVTRLLARKATPADLKNSRYAGRRNYRPRRTRRYVRRTRRYVRRTRRRSRNFIDKESGETSEQEAAGGERRELQREAKIRRRRAYYARRQRLAKRRRAYYRRRRVYRRTYRRRTRRRTRSRYYSVYVRNRCRRRVNLFIGRKPRFSSGLNTSLSGNSSRSFSGFAPKTIWIVDSSRRGISSFVFYPGRYTINITRSCMGFAVR